MKRWEILLGVAVVAISAGFSTLARRLRRYCFF